MFIRTKDRIIDTTKIATGSKYMDFATNDDSFREIFKTEPLAEADNLAELCDEFVLYDNQFETYGVFDKKVITFKWLKEHFGIYDKGMTLYGAVWTSKGLIFAAKMNENGELVLI